MDLFLFPISPQENLQPLKESLDSWGFETLFNKLKTFKFNSFVNFLQDQTPLTPIEKNISPNSSPIPSLEDSKNQRFFTQISKERVSQDFFPNLEKFYFTNLFFLFFLIESLNFAFLGGNSPQNKKFLQRENPNSLKKKQYFFASIHSLNAIKEKMSGNFFFQKKMSVLNPLKLGFLFGLFVDAFKVGS
jgi:hypothetical protein